MIAAEEEYLLPFGPPGAVIWLSWVGTRPRSRCVSRSWWDDHNRAVGVLGDLGADRAQQQPLEPAGSAGADDEQVRARSRLKERRGGKGDDRPDGD
jgi:hypothetical protein